MNLYILTLENPNRYKGNGLDEIFGFTIAVVKAKDSKQVFKILKKASESEDDVNGDLDIETLSMIKVNFVFELKGEHKAGIVTTYLGTYP